MTETEQERAVLWGRMVEDAFDEGIWILILAEVRENGLPEVNDVRT